MKRVALNENGVVTIQGEALWQLCFSWAAVNIKQRMFVFKFTAASWIANFSLFSS